MTRFRPLLADRTAWNKLFRRSFWDAHDLRFPEGVVHEDIPVILPAHFLARSVDVLSAHVYRWRLREGEDRSITQRRLDFDVLRDRLDASSHVLGFLRERGPEKAVRWYQGWLAADDLRFHLNLLPDATPEYRDAFMDGARHLLGDAPARAFAGLRAIDRLKWHLVLGGRLDEAVEAVRFHREELGERPPVRRGPRWYGDYPFRGDGRLGVPRTVFRLGREDEDLQLKAHLEAVEVRDGALELRGLAYVNALGAPRPGSSQARFLLLPPGRFRALRMRVAAIRLPAQAVERPELAASAPGRRDRSWAGFRVTIDPARLPARAAEGTWELAAHVVTRGVSRRRTRFALEAPELARTVALPAPGGALVDVATGPDGSVRVRRRAHWALARRAVFTAWAVELAGDASWPDGPPRGLVARRASDGAEVPGTIEATASGFTARVDLAGLLAAPASPERAAGAPGAADEWALLAGGLALSLDAGAAAEVAAGDRELRLEATRWGDARLVDRPAATAGPPPAAPPAPPRSSPAAG